MRQAASEELRATQGCTAASSQLSPGHIRGSQGQSHSTSLTHSRAHSFTHALARSLPHAPGQETAGSYAVGGLGGFVYLRMLQRSVDSYGAAHTSPAAMVGSMGSNNRLLVPFALTLAFNRCCSQEAGVLAASEEVPEGTVVGLVVPTLRACHFSVFLVQDVALCLSMRFAYGMLPFAAHHHVAGAQQGPRGAAPSSASGSALWAGLAQRCLSDSYVRCQSWDGGSRRGRQGHANVHAGCCACPF